jgi:hypothetical protein
MGGPRRIAGGAAEAEGEGVFDLIADQVEDLAAGRPVTEEEGPTPVFGKGKVGEKVEVGMDGCHGEKMAREGPMVKAEGGESAFRAEKDGL